jgi:hypothetical protein
LGESLETNLRKAGAAAKLCGAVLRVLSVEGRFSSEEHGEIRRRLDWIIAGVERLKTLPPHEWLSAFAATEAAPKSDPRSQSEETVERQMEPSLTVDEAPSGEVLDESVEVYDYEEIPPWVWLT